jgi:hypothetical protein
MNKFQGLNFRDETLWRGRMLGFTYVIRATLTELGGWLAALVIAYEVAALWPRYNFVLAVAALMGIRMIGTHYDDWKRLTAVEEDANAYLDLIEKRLDASP